jgi:inhibitor of cysteine peptidase
MGKKAYMVGGVIIVLLIIIVVLMMRGPSEVQLTAADNGSTVELESGQALSITLGANPTTGYTWEVVEAPGEQVMRQVGEIEFEPESEAIGAGGVQIIRFECVNAGQTVLKLVYHRPWETDVEPLETFTIHVAARR